MKRAVVVITTILISSVFLNTLVSAANLITLSQVNLDTNITKEDSNFITPDKILIVPIFPPSEELDTNDTTWFRGLYYYTIQRLGFNDIPFHYVVTKTGKVFEGNSGGDERRINISGIDGNPIVIGYLSDRFASNFDPRSMTALKNLTLEVANANAVKPENIQISSIKFVKDSATRTVSMEKSDVIGSWGLSLTEITNFVKQSYAPVKKTYSVELTAKNLTTDSVEPGSEVIGSITIKNTSENAIYSGTQSELILTKTDGAQSSFFLNNEWLSPTQFSIMKDEETILPGRESTFEFKLKAPLFIGNKTESFEIKNINGDKVSSTIVELTLNLQSSTKKIVEIKNTELGYLRVRSDASSVASETGRVSPGQRFFMLEDAGNGYIKIDLGDGKSGWVSIQYLNFIN